VQIMRGAVAMPLGLLEMLGLHRKGLQCEPFAWRGRRPNDTTMDDERIADAAGITKQPV